MTDLAYKISLKPNAMFIYKDMQPHRFVTLTTGRRYGKTSLIRTDITHKALKHSDINICYTAPTYKMAKELMWAPLIDKMPVGAIKDMNKTDLYIKLINGSKIHLFGTQNYDSMRGMGFDFVDLDEAAYQPYEAWSEVLRQTIATTKGFVRFISTPNGKGNWYYDLTLQEGIKHYFRTSIEGGWIDKQEIEQAKSQLDERTFKQEYLASFETSGSTVYYAYGDRNNCDYTYSPSRKTILAWDFNVNPLCTIIIQEIEKDKWAAVKEFVINQQNTENQCIIIDEWLTKYGKPTVLEITGDATGNSYNTKATVSDYNIIEKYFKNYTGYIKKIMVTKRQKNRVAATNAMFMNAGGNIRLFINKKQCPKLDKDLKVVEWKESGSEINKSLGVSDASDALSYFPYNYYPIITQIESYLV